METDLMQVASVDSVSRHRVIIVTLKYDVFDLNSTILFNEIS